MFFNEPKKKKNQYFHMSICRKYLKTQKNNACLHKEKNNLKTKKKEKSIYKETRERKTYPENQKHFGLINKANKGSKKKKIPNV